MPENGGACLDKCAAGCGNSSTTGLRACSRCRQVAYCDTNCQRKHWPEHKSVCHSKSQDSKPAPGNVSATALQNPPDTFVNPDKSAIFAQSASEEDLLQVLVSVPHTVDAALINPDDSPLSNLTLRSLVTNKSTQPVLLSAASCAVLTLRNGSITKPYVPSDDSSRHFASKVIELDGRCTFPYVPPLPAEAVLRPSKTLVVEHKFPVPGAHFENEALKRCAKLNVRVQVLDSATDASSTTGEQRSADAVFDLELTRRVYRGFRPGLVRLGGDATAPTWQRLEGDDDDDEDAAEYNDEANLDGFTVRVKARTDPSLGTRQVSVSRLELDVIRSRVLASFNRFIDDGDAPFVAVTSITKMPGNASIASDADLTAANIRDLDTLVVDLRH